MSARKRTFRLTRGGWALLPVCLLLGLGAFNAGLNVTYLLACLSLSLFVLGVALPVWNGRGLDCRREIPRPPVGGEPFEYALTLRSRRRSAAAVVRVHDPLGGPAAGRALFLRVPPRGSERLACVGAPLRRGVYPMPGLAWRSGFPFGIAEFGGRRRGEGELLVYPARGRLTGRLRLAPQSVNGVRAGVPNVAGTPGDDFRSLREYRPGDHPRWIHWRASAHLGSLQVREMERESSGFVCVLLDSRIPDGLPAEEFERAEAALETAVSFAAEVCRAALRAGMRVRLAAFFPEPRWIASPEGRRAGSLAARLEPLLDALARLKPSRDATAAALAATARRAGLSAAGRVVAVSPTPETARSLAEAFSLGAGRVHAPSDPDFTSIFRLAPERRGSEA